jgi:integrase
VRFWYALAPRSPGHLTVVIDHLRCIPGFGICVFPWDQSRRRLQEDFATIQELAKIHLPCKVEEEHERTRCCHSYGFHDLRRAFATMNADRRTANALQHLIRHRSYATTQRYIAMSRQMAAVAAALHVPEVLRAGLG